MKHYLNISKCLLVTIFVIFLIPGNSNAQNTASAPAGVGSGATKILGVPIDTSYDFQNVMRFQKEFKFDRFAVMVAKRILHSMTMDVVDWINKGFKGNPAFLSNPNGFFLNAVDQETGRFIFDGGLTGLCSPFEIDLKAALYMGQAYSDTVYTCTLSTIIGNAANLPNNVSINGSSIRGFMGGDFTQGGWPAFIAMTTEPQNNPTGAYLKANSQLRANIANTKADINLDLNRSGGFLSWQDCVEVPQVSSITNVNSQQKIDGVSAPTTQAQGTADDFGYDSAFGTLNPAGYNFNSTQVVQYDNLVDPSVKPTIKNCETKTPGSVIAGSVNKSLGAGQDELIAADDMNAVVNALITTLAKTVLTTGLKTISGGGSNSSSNYSSTRYREMIEADYQQNAQDTLSSFPIDSSNQIGYIATIKSNYDKAADIITKSKNSYLSTRACYANKDSRLQFSNSISYIDQRIKREVDPLLTTLLQKQTNAQALYNQSLSTTSVPVITDSTSEVRDQVTINVQQFAALAGITQATVDTSIADLQNAISKGSIFDADSARLLNNCRD